MRLVTFQRHAYTEPGLLLGEEIIGLRGAGFEDVLSIVARGADALASIADWASRPPYGEVIPLRGAKLRAPRPRPQNIISVGLNYRDPAAAANLEIPDVPTIFSKFPTAVIGPGEPVMLPRVTAKPDFEAEFAFIVGPRCRRVPGDRWRDFVFGYTIFNDVSARDFQMATTQWVLGKSFDTFAPMGPWLVTADEIPDPHALNISLTLNGEVMQSSNTSHLIFKIPDLIEHLSAVCTLEPGDVISTGTSAGVGFARKPPRFLRDGEEMGVRVEWIGEMRNQVMSEAA